MSKWWFALIAAIPGWKCQIHGGQKSKKYGKSLFYGPIDSKTLMSFERFSGFE